MLDAKRMTFTIVDLPPGEWSTKLLVIVEAGEGKLGMFGFHGKTESDLNYSIAQNQGENPSHWKMEKTVSLDSGYKYCIEVATESSLLLRRTETWQGSPHFEYFSMDVKTLQLQRIFARQGAYIMMFNTHIYTNFPPSLLSSRTI